ncbi:MAG: metallophosphoesterase [Candidatus Kapaibacteriales bacterium]
MYTFFFAFFLIYFLSNLYIFVRGWQALELFAPIRWIYAVVFVLCVFSYVVAKVFSKVLPLSLYSVILWIGSIWFFLLVYFLMLVLLIDFTRFLNSFFNFLPAFIHKNYLQTKFYVLLLVLGITFISASYGYLNRSNIKLKTIEVSTDKQMGKEYRLVFFSDLHLTPINDHFFLSNVVSKVNSLQPDLILIGGDLADEDVVNLRRWKIADEFRNFRSKFGNFAILGNHEYLNNADSLVKHFTTLGIRFLIDDFVEIDNSFILVGRDDRSRTRYRKENRKSLAEITREINSPLPRILLDHVPLDLNEAQEHNYILQLSGHTHNGQFFPGNLITSMIYRISCGYKKIGSTHYYVSSGVGSWGPPIKIFSDAEIVLIILKL